MMIFEQMQEITEKLILQHGIECEISSQELKTLINVHFGTNPSSIIPSDYCYNRANKGIVFSGDTRLLVYGGRGVYICLGKNYPYDKPVYTRPKGTKTDIVVGTWEKGVFTPNINWELCGLRLS